MPDSTHDFQPLSHPDKLEFISHTNDEHQNELAMIVAALTDLDIAEIIQVNIEEIYNQGVRLCIEQTNTTTKRSQVIPFSDPIHDLDGLRGQYVSLMQLASKRLGKKSIRLQDQSFIVQDSYHVTSNMLRLVVSAPPQTPQSHPGYAYQFDLTTPAAPQALGTTLSANTTRSHCYYTLRRAWQPSSQSAAHRGSPDAGTKQMMAWFDIYLHGDTPGSNWARRLRAGHTIKSLREYPEKLDHLSSGQCLLIVDETSLPTAARLLETWQNPLAPVVIVITNDPDDASYLDNIDREVNNCLIKVSERAIILTILKTDELELADYIDQQLKTHPATASLTIEKIWGALEAGDTKALRRRLKASLDLPRQDLVLRSYWRRQ